MIYQSDMIAHLWKRANGKYYALWSDQGQSRQISLRTTDRRIAMSRLNDLNRRLRAGKVAPIRPQGSTLEEFTERYLAHLDAQATRGTIRPATYTLFSVALDKMAQAWGPEKNLMILRPADFDRLLDTMTKLAPATINKNMRHVKAALRQAVKWNMARQVEFPRQLKEHTEIRYFQAEELTRLVAAIPDPEFADICLLAAYSGLRSGEILRLTARDIDNPPGFLRITAEQKNGTESRIPISSKMREILDRHHRHIGRLFTIRSVSGVSQRFKRYARAAKFPDRRFHDLRHTYGAHLVMAGVDIRKVQLLMRHRSIESTMVYTRLFPADLVESSNVLNYGEVKTG